MPRNSKPSNPPRTKATKEGIAPTVTVSEQPKGRGRPTLYTEDVAEEICSRIALGETLNQICRSTHMPARPTIVGWVMEDRQGFSDRYARARDLCLEHWADEVLEIGDDGTNDWMVREHGDDDKNASWVVNGEHVSRSRLRIDSRKWLLSKLKPERYGDKLQVGGDPTGTPLKHVIETHIIDPQDQG